MKILISVSFFAMAVAHLVDLSVLRYAPVIAILTLILVMGKTVYQSDKTWYTVGGLIVIIGSAVPSVMHGNSLSYAYIVFGALNFALYPLFEKVELTNSHLALIFFGLLVTLVPLGAGYPIASIYGNPNNFCAVAFSTMYFGMLLFRGRLSLQLGVLAIFMILVIWSASRSMLGALLIFAMLYGAQRYVFHTVFRRLVVLGFLVGAGAYFTLITNDQFRLMETIQQTTVGAKKGKGLSHRDELFFYSIDLVSKQPEGVGLGMSKDALEGYYGEDISPHNTYLKVLVEGGWVSLVGFLIIIFGFFLTSTSPLATAFVFALMVRGFFESATPFTISLISGMLIIPMFLNENSVLEGERLVFRKSVIKEN